MDSERWIYRHAEIVRVRDSEGVQYIVWDGDSVHSMTRIMELAVMQFVKVVKR